jgi:hypothetical protein
VAHHLDQTAGTTSFVSAREDAWHALGTTLPRTFDTKPACCRHCSGSRESRCAEFFKNSLCHALAARRRHNRRRLHVDSAISCGVELVETAFERRPANSRLQAFSDPHSWEGGTNSRSESRMQRTGQLRRGSQQVCRCTKHLRSAARHTASGAIGIATGCRRAAHDRIEHRRRGRHGRTLHLARCHQPRRRYWSGRRGRRAEDLCDLGVRCVCRNLDLTALELDRAGH